MGTVSFLKIRDGKLIQCGTLARSFSSCPGKHQERQNPLCVSGGKGSLRPFARAEGGVIEDPGFSCFHWKVLRALHHAVMLRAGM